MTIVILYLVIVRGYKRLRFTSKLYNSSNLLKFTILKTLLNRIPLCFISIESFNDKIVKHIIHNSNQIDFNA